MDIRTILVPFDFSESAERAFAWAVPFAQQWGAKIIVAHALPLWHHISLPERLFVDLQKADAAIKAEAEQQLQNFLGTKRDTTTVTIDTQLLRGEPVEEICALAKRAPAELIVMGSHGRTGVAHAVLGSVAERVVRYALCPVLVVRQGVQQ
jgi:nucleotide-binding universal stress UspA family protein